jgi:hypothetical protein
LSTFSYWRRKDPRVSITSSHTSRQGSFIPPQYPASSNEGSSRRNSVGSAPDHSPSSPWGDQTTTRCHAFGAFFETAARRIPTFQANRVLPDPGGAQQHSRKGRRSSRGSPDHFVSRHPLLSEFCIRTTPCPRNFGTVPTAPLDSMPFSGGQYDFTLYMDKIGYSAPGFLTILSVLDE